MKRAGAWATGVTGSRRWRWFWGQSLSLAPQARFRAMLPLVAPRNPQPQGAHNQKR